MTDNVKKRRRESPSSILYHEWDYLRTREKSLSLGYSKRTVEMYVAFTVIIFLVAMVLQTTVFHLIQIGGVKPDLVLILVVYFGLTKGSDIGCVSGFAFGLIEDMFSGMSLGANALTKTIVGFLCGFSGKHLYTQSLVTHILCVGVSTIIDVLLLFSIHGFLLDWENILIYETIYNMICCPWIVYLLRFGERRLRTRSSSFI
ncbi:rod shape-determining protein MreD [candidate division KSB3 bacterium]|uniref:Rod shape-determining protein MreD n=1 Tax=candidate division KSB3 bacterium TaxID=2044937 RepID=A0A9D5JS30_9BACT|nr:rod shape-determining protein MreD [candidate division KSB3 bacterium]MBD3322987.1 rod shape-determining protein MreD [candidate division KSB3 bacterium]